jgi:hypothetical protein
VMKFRRQLSGQRGGVLMAKGISSVKVTTPGYLPVLWRAPGYLPAEARRSCTAVL